jgi:Tfp pilus assembly protein PilF
VLRADVDHGGGFHLRSPEAGSYEARLLSPAGNLVQQEMVWIQDAPGALTIHFRENRTAAPFSGTVAAAPLQHHPPSGAVKEFRKGLEAMRRQDPPCALTHLHKALELDPDYFDAHELLGIVHLTANRYEEAASEFETAVRLDSGSAAAHRNLALSLSHQNRFAEAVAPARQAVRLAPGDPATHWVLGGILATLGAAPEEALRHLRLAAERFPQARLAMAQMLYRRGARAEAAEALQGYLHDQNVPPNVSDRKTVEAWYARLRQPATPAP